MRTREDEISHIEENRERFWAHQGYERDVREYFDEYDAAFRLEGDSLYECLCSDLELEPLPR